MMDDRTRQLLFEESYRKYRHIVYRLGLRYGSGRTDWAEDHAHDVFLKLHKNLPHLNLDDDLGGWLYRVSANLAISRLRKESSGLNRLKQLFEQRSTLQAGSPDIDTRLFQKEQAQALLASLKKLPPREQVMLTMRLLDGKTQKEISETLLVSEGYVSKVIVRGLKQLEDQGWEVKNEI